MVVSPTLMPMRKFDAPFQRHIGFALGHATRHVDRAAHRIDHTGEFQWQAVTMVLVVSVVMQQKRRGLSHGQVLAHDFEARRLGSITLVRSFAATTGKPYSGDQTSQGAFDEPSPLVVGR
jgi:hypothetical protein